MKNKILVIDNDENIRSVFEEALESFFSEGGELLIADDLETGLKIVEQEGPQLIFASTHVRGFNQTSLETLQAKVILLSQDDLIKNQFVTLVKPIKPQTITEKCWEVFKHHSTTDIPLM